MSFSFSLIFSISRGIIKQKGEIKMKLLVVLYLMSAAVCLAGRTDLNFDDAGNVVTKPGTEQILKFPNISTAYVVGEHFRVLTEAELGRWQSVHLDMGFGEQFLGVSLGYTFFSLGNLSVLGGTGYDFDDKRMEWFAGFSHQLSLFGIGGLKSFSGYDVVLGHLRSGFGYELKDFGSWSLDLIGTARFIGGRNFLGLSAGYDLFQGAGNFGGKKIQADLGVFVGYDFDELRSNKAGAGVALNLRF